MKRRRKPKPTETERATYVHAATVIRDAGKVAQREFARWLAEGVLDRVPFRGRATRYSARNVLQARAARVLLDSGRTLRECAAITRAVSNDELQRVIDGTHGHPAPESTAPKPSDDHVPVGKAVTWYELELLTGLRVALRSDASEFVRRVAREIAAKYRTDPGASS